MQATYLSQRAQVIPNNCLEYRYWGKYMYWNITYIENAILVPFDNKFIRWDQRAQVIPNKCLEYRYWGKYMYWNITYIENAILVPFDNKFIRWDQKQQKNSELNEFLVKSDKLIKRHLYGFLFIMHH